MCVCCLINRQIFHSLLKSGIISIKDDHILRKDLGVDSVSRERFIRVLSFWDLVLRNLLQKDASSILLVPWVAIKDESFILASSRIHLKANNSIKNIVWQANFNCSSIKFRVLLLVSSLFILSNSDIFQFLNFRPYFFAKWILEFHRRTNQISNFNVRNAIGLR